jgi:hypothetical protein
MQMRVRYRAQRGEIWAMYRRLWRQRLWRYHATLVLAVLVGLLLQFGIPHSPARWLILLLPPLVPPLLLALYPQLAFKPQERVLTLDVSGITTTIGKRAGAIPWSDVAAVHRGSAITIERTNGNAFVVPARAFASDDERRRFADFAISSALRAAG